MKAVQKTMLKVPTKQVMRANMECLWLRMVHQVMLYLSVLKQDFFFAVALVSAKMSSRFSYSISATSSSEADMLSSPGIIKMQANSPTVLRAPKMYMVTS